MKRYLIFGAIGPFVGGLLMLFAITLASGYWAQTRLDGGREILRHFRQDAAIQLSVRRRAGADDRRHRRHPVSRAADPPWLRIIIVGAIGFTVTRTALWLARPGHRRDAVPPLRAGRRRARDAVVVAGAQICRRAGAGAFDVKSRQFGATGKSLPIVRNRVKRLNFRKSKIFLFPSPKSPCTSIAIPSHSEQLCRSRPAIGRPQGWR